MATITTPSVIYTMLTNNGHFEDDPAPARIYYYETPNAPGVAHYAVFYRLADDDMASSPYVAHRALLFDSLGVTEAGLLWIAMQDYPEAFA